MAGRRTGYAIGWPPGCEKCAQPLSVRQTALAIGAVEIRCQGFKDCSSRTMKVCANQARLPKCITPELAVLDCRFKLTAPPSQSAAAEASGGPEKFFEGRRGCRAFYDLAKSSLPFPMNEPTLRTNQPTHGEIEACAYFICIPRVSCGSRAITGNGTDAISPGHRIKPTKGNHMKRTLLNSAAILVLAVAALGLSACATDDGGTHLMGGRGESGMMADEMMPSRQ